MSRTFDTFAVGGLHGFAESNVGGRLHAQRFGVAEAASFQAITYTNDGREILIGRHLLASNPQYAIPAGSPYYTCDTNGDSTNKGVTEGESAYGEVVRYRREQFEAVASRTVGTLPELAGAGIQLITSPHAAVMWDYGSTLPSGNYELAPYEPRFGTELSMAPNDLYMLVLGRGTSESSIPSCGIGWYPNDPSADDVTECNNDGTGIRYGYQLYSRASVTDDWTLASSKWYSLFSYDNYAPTIRGDGWAWSNRGRSGGNAATWDVWPADEDPATTTSNVTVTLPASTIFSWVHVGDLTVCLANNDNMYVYDGESLSQTLTEGSGIVYWYDAKGEWLMVVRGAADTIFYRLEGGTYTHHSTETDPITNAPLLGTEGVMIDGGSERWTYNPDTDRWEWGLFYPGGVLMEDGFSFSAVLDREAVYWHDDERVAFAAIS